MLQRLFIILGGIVLIALPASTRDDPTFNILVMDDDTFLHDPGRLETLHGQQLWPRRLEAQEQRY